jgi:hypothetical protein
MAREEDLQYKITAAFEAINLYELGNMTDYRYDPKTALAYSIRKGAIAAEHLGDIESKFKLYEKAREHGVFEEVFSGVESLRDDEVDPAIRLKPGVRPWKPPGVMEMKLTKTKLNKLITDVLKEVQLAPQIPSNISDARMMKIHALIHSGEHEMAKALLDALGAPTYFDDYMRYMEVGEVEKLANKHMADIGIGSSLEDLEEYFGELDKFQAREMERGRPFNEPAREFHDRYRSIEDAHRRGPLAESYSGDDSILEHFHGATLQEGGLVCEACLFETLYEASCGCPDLMGEAEYQGRKVTLNKPTRGDVKKFKVYVKDPKTGNIKKVNFGDPNMRIKKSNPKRRKSFRARHNCKNPGPKTKARYWSCKKW